MARNVTKNRTVIRGQTAPKSIRIHEFDDNTTSTSFTIMTHTDVIKSIDREGNITWDDPRPEFHRVVMRGRIKLAELLKTKSLMLEVEGELRYREYTQFHATLDTATNKWVETLDANGQKIPVTHRVAEIVIGRRGSIEIMPCVNRPDEMKERAQQTRTRQQPHDNDDDLGPIFPSEVSGMDDVPF